ncbi:MAG: HAD-IB family hydrolase [Alphaproteobacteria bacterium]|nr:MAG: HAD-IB family hydrolase [Alphaproteobacteria bacterium]
MAQSKEPRPIAVFDLDRTITRIGSFTPFCLYAAWRLSPLRLAFLPLAVLALASTGLKLTSRKMLKTVMLALLVGRARRADIDRVARDFVDGMMRNYLRPYASVVIADERARGAVLYLATASYDFYASEFATRLGFDGVVATRSIWTDNRLVPGIDGENCYGAEKLRRVEERLLSDGVIAPGQPRPHVTFYSDDKSDLPCFDWADRSVAVNPKPKLARMATRLGLEVVAW